MFQIWNFIHSALDSVKSSLKSLFFEPITAAEVFRMIHHLNTKKANGPENIAVKYYKLANEYICSFFREIFNTWALQGIFPHELKLAKVIPIYKSGCDSSPNNYRPISLLSPLAKVFESLILTRMSKFIAENKILCKEQFGFRKLHSTNHVLSDIFPLSIITGAIVISPVLFSLTWRKHSTLLITKHFYLN